MRCMCTEQHILYSKNFDLTNWSYKRKAFKHPICSTVERTTFSGTTKLRFSLCAPRHQLSDALIVRQALIRRVSACYFTRSRTRSNLSFEIPQLHVTLNMNQSPLVTCQCFSYLLMEFQTVEMRRRVHNPAFFAYGHKTRTSTRPTPEINSALATSTPLTIAAILLCSRTKAVVVNAIQSEIQNLQRQCRRCQGLSREWSPYNHYT